MSVKNQRGRLPSFSHAALESSQVTSPDAPGVSGTISRRDFLNGVALTIGAAALPVELNAMLAMDKGGPITGVAAPRYYPPALTGLRGSNDGSFEAAHALRDGGYENAVKSAHDTGEEYDIVIVGAGISGLAAAYYYRQAKGPRAKILLLDNHDDFGGHARRNEYHLPQRTLLGYGGTFSIESPQPYSEVAKKLISDLGIEVASFPKLIDRSIYRKQGLRPGIFFDKETFGLDVSLPSPFPLGASATIDKEVGVALWARFLREAPLAPEAKANLQRLLADTTDYYPGLTSDQKKAKLAKVSYTDYLTNTVKVHREVVKLFQAVAHPLFGLGIDAVPAQDAAAFGFPGFVGLKLAEGYGPGQNMDSRRSEEGDAYFYHFPDGNSSIARLLLRQLIPAAVGGKNATDIVQQKTNYAKLDESASSVRLRLNSTVLNVKQVAPSGGNAKTTKSVEVTYIRDGKVQSVRAKQSILACWHVMIPYICPELPEKQREALSFAVKVPLLYTNVVIRNWQAWKKLGLSFMYSPGSYHTFATLDMPVSIGDYHCPQNPDEPIVVHMMKAPCKPGAPTGRDQHRAGRAELLRTSFATIERNVKDQLNRSLGPGGFDSEKDILAITVNRWPHGYAYQYNSLFDDFWFEGRQTPCEVARQKFGSIAIANSDAGAYAYTDCAIDHAHRAVQELLG